MRDRTFPRFGGRLVLLGHRLRGHRVTWEPRHMLVDRRLIRPCRIYDCACGRAWVVYEDG